MKKDSNIKFRLVAYTDAAGKFTPDAVRGGNEDNFFVDDNLDANAPTQMKQDEILNLSSLGVLMVVADGMGGMNAGEIASQIAIDTVRDAFVKDKLTESVTSSPESRSKYMEKVIKAADKAIKTDARNNPEHEGMGSTIIMAWLFNNELTISWCGDSRAYVFNDKNGIRLISRDHSYVQELVNKGVLTYVQTFDHPQNNIVTRSLGDPTKEAKPESKTVKVGKGDIILLCSDGLSGVLRDRKTFNEKGIPYPEQNIEDIIRANTSSMKECRQALWNAAEKGGWYDNVTAILCQIVDGPASPVLANDPTTSTNNKKGGFLKWGLLFLLVLIAVGVFCFFLGKTSNEIEEADNLKDSIENQIDTIQPKEIVKPNPEPPTEKQDVVETKKPKEDKKQTITEQVVEQNEPQVDDSKQDADSELTPIKSNNDGKNKLTPISPNEQKPNVNPLENPNNKDNPLSKV